MTSPPLASALRQLPPSQIAGHNIPSDIALAADQIIYSHDLSHLPGWLSAAPTDGVSPPFPFSPTCSSPNPPRLRGVALWTSLPRPDVLPFNPFSISRPFLTTYSSSLHRLIPTQPIASALNADIASAEETRINGASKLTATGSAASAILASASAENGGSSFAATTLSSSSTVTKMGTSSTTSSGTSTVTSGGSTTTSSSTQTSSVSSSGSTGGAQGGKATGVVVAAGMLAAGVVRVVEGLWGGVGRALRGGCGREQTAGWC